MRIARGGGGGVGAVPPVSTAAPTLAVVEEPPLATLVPHPTLALGLATPADVLNTPTPHATLVLVYPSVDYGLLCNNLQQIAGTLDFAASVPDDSIRVVLAFHEGVSESMRKALDVDHLVRIARVFGDLDLAKFRFRFEPTPPRSEEPTMHAVDVVLGWTDADSRAAVKAGMGFAVLRSRRWQHAHTRDFSLATAMALRPSPALRAQAAASTQRFRERFPGVALVSIHRRYLGWCRIDYKKYSPFCGDANPRFRETNYFRNDCNVTAEDLADAVKSEQWRRIPELAGASALPPSAESLPLPHEGGATSYYAVFLATDLHDVGGDEAFRHGANAKVAMIEHAVNIEHEVEEEYQRVKSQRGISRKTYVLEKTNGTLNMNWDLTMLVDMQAEVDAVLSLGAPYSSCDRILAMWKSAYARVSLVEGGAKEMERAFAALRDASSVRTYPAKCYEEFERPRSRGWGVAEEREWWVSVGMPALRKRSSSVTRFGGGDRRMDELRAFASPSTSKA